MPAHLHQTLRASWRRITQEITSGNDPIAQSKSSKEGVCVGPLVHERCDCRIINSPFVSLSSLHPDALSSFGAPLASALPAILGSPLPSLYPCPLASSSLFPLRHPSHSPCAPFPSDHVITRRAGRLASRGQEKSGCRRALCRWRRRSYTCWLRCGGVGTGARPRCSVR